MTPGRGSPFIAALMGAIFFRLLSGGSAHPGHDTLRTFAAGFLGAAAAWFCTWSSARLAERFRSRRPGRS